VKEKDARREKMTKQNQREAAQTTTNWGGKFLKNARSKNGAMQIKRKKQTEGNEVEKVPKSEKILESSGGGGKKNQFV